MLRETFVRDGRVWLRGAVAPDELSRLRDLYGSGNRPGARVAGSDPLFQAVEAAAFTATIRALWPGMRPVRLVSFDKNPQANWGVPWHQDRVIAVRDRADVPGFTNWSRKQDAWHCEPPPDLLARMLFVRVHLDASAASSGAMEIAPGSHRAGRVASEDAAAVAERHDLELTVAEPGDVLVLAMLTLHRSLPAVTAERRRTLRIDYAPFDLPESLEWAA